MNETRIRRARKDHQCTEASWHTIKAGNLYLSAVCSPWHEMARGKKWWIIKACLRCANKYGLHTSDTRKAIEDHHGLENLMAPIVRPVQEDRDVFGSAEHGSREEGKAIRLESDAGLPALLPEVRESEVA